MKKRYYNSTTKEWYTEGNSLTRRVNGALFSGVPSVEQLTAWGFEEWHEPEPTPEQLLERAKQQKIAELEAYDQSDAVNSFSYGGVEMWLDKATRVGLLLRITAEQSAGESTTTLWFGTMSFEIPIASAFQMLYAIEKYASGCYDKTAAHKAAISSLNTVDAVANYDFTVGYPEKLTFSV